MVASLARIFGIQNLDLAEDVVQDAFCRALDAWKQRGMPDNPAAWLMKTAKNRAIDVLRRERTARTFEPALARSYHSEWTLVPTVNELLDPAAIEDDQLRMMFTCCHPRLNAPAQIALVLNLLCGFSIDEIAHAFLSGHAAIEKRIQRAKKVLAQTNDLFDLADRDFPARLASVQRALYLLFSEGYHSASPSAAVRSELCEEAMRLATLLRDRELTATPSTRALCALMYLNAARLPGRLDAAGELSSLSEQDRSRWDRALIEKGSELLDASATGEHLSEYHVEAAIALVHARAPSVAATDWSEVVRLYDILMKVRPSPIIALNRAIAIAQAEGPARGLAAIREIQQSERLGAYPFYHAALGDLEAKCGAPESAVQHFREALALAHNPAERRYLQRRIATIEMPQRI